MENTDRKENGAIALQHPGMTSGGRWPRPTAAGPSPVIRASRNISSCRNRKE
jgi:hypothetical protein